MKNDNNSLYAKKFENPDYMDFRELDKNITLEHNWEQASFDDNIWIKPVYADILKIGIRVEHSRTRDLTTGHDGNRYKRFRKMIVPNWLLSKKRVYTFFTTIVNTNFIAAFATDGYLNGYTKSLYPGYDSADERTKHQMEACAYARWAGTNNMDNERYCDKVEAERQNAFMMTKSGIDRFIARYQSVR